MQLAYFENVLKSFEKGDVVCAKVGACLEMLRLFGGLAIVDGV